VKIDKHAKANFTMVDRGLMLSLCSEIKKGNEGQQPNPAD
jgi:hypothetical protein